MFKLTNYIIFNTVKESLISFQTIKKPVSGISDTGFSKQRKAISSLKRNDHYCAAY